MQYASLIHARGGIQVVLQPSQEIVSAVRRRGVHHARAGIHGDVFGEHAEHVAIEKRMAEVDALQPAAWEPSDFARVFKLAFRDNILRQLRSHDVDLTARFECDVVFVGMKCDRHRGR